MSSSDQDQGMSVAHRKLRVSTTIDRRKVVRPTKDCTVLKKVSDANVPRSRLKTSDMVANIKAPKITTTTLQKTTSRPTAKQLKESAIEKALVAATKNSSKEKKKEKVYTRFGFRRVLLALTCAAVAVFAIVYFVNLNAPNISLKVAAMQTGIEASYPSYIPRDFNLSNITSESGKITLNFRNLSNNDAFSLIEERSSWDSNTLLNNYVREVFGKDFATMREQGLTIYIGNNNAAWVNGGIVYKLNITAGSLTKKQIRSIAVSL